MGVGVDVVIRSTRVATKPAQSKPERNFVQLCVCNTHPARRGYGLDGTADARKRYFCKSNNRKSNNQTESRGQDAYTNLTCSAPRARPRLQPTSAAAAPPSAPVPPPPVARRTSRRPTPQRPPAAASAPLAPVPTRAAPSRERRPRRPAFHPYVHFSRPRAVVDCSPCPTSRAPGWRRRKMTPLPAGGRRRSPAGFRLLYRALRAIGGPKRSPLCL